MPLVVALLPDQLEVDRYPRSQVTADLASRVPEDAAAIQLPSQFQSPMFVWSIIVTFLLALQYLLQQLHPFPIQPATTSQISALPKKKFK